MSIAYAQNQLAGDARTGWLSPGETELVRTVHQHVPGYEPSPLVQLDALAGACGLGKVLVKDESGRFGLKAFKGLGGVYAMFRVICDELGLDPRATTVTQLREGPLAAEVSRLAFATTTDGNHGKGVSWAAGLFGCQAHVFMPVGTVEARAQAARDAGRGHAQVTVTNMRYDDCVRHTAALASKQGWHLLQDTSWEGYEEVPRLIMQGYTTMVLETAEQLAAAGIGTPTHVFLQAGVGSMAAAVAGALVELYGAAAPAIFAVEPIEVACFYESVLAGDGMPHAATGSGQTIMAGLNCAEPCTLAWPILQATMRGAFACDDEVTRRGMRRLAHPLGDDSPIVSGESGAVTCGLVEALMTDAALAPLRGELALGGDSVVLLISTEGDTDPDAYRQVITV